MKFNKLILATSLLLSGAFAMNAQEEVTEYAYKTNWYIQGQFGGQETLGETSFGKLLSPTAQIAAGVNFNPYIGMRLAVNAWGSKASETINALSHNETYRWKWNYVSGNIDVTFNLTNILGGYKPNRLVDVDLFAGIGANVGWNNKEAQAQNQKYQQTFGAVSGGNPLQAYLWDGTKTRFMGNFGADIWFNCSEHVAVGLELNANMLNDKYNSKKADNIDWYFNGMVGVRYTFGKKYTKTTRIIEPACPPCEETIVEKIVEKIVEVPVVVEQPEVKQKEPLRRDIFFTISNTVIANSEKYKVDEIANYLKEHPGSVVYVTGYADKGTGTKAINLRLSKQRAQAVYNALVNEYGIAKDRIHVASMDDSMEQPYATPAENRVAICIAEEK
ncbi:MAG: OmpA family protein [Muribaculaceae bacterium]|nr:OmpA family protein [Muribaculaceae bacterium]